jgi:hypothetical protein
MRRDYSETDRVRQGTGPLDNLMVLVISLFLLGIAGFALFYWFYGAPG